SARPQNSPGINQFEPLRRLACADRKRARPGPRTGRAGANVLRGASSLLRREASMSNDHDNDRDRDHANDNGEHEKAGSNKPVAAAPAGGALTSLAALKTALAGVNKAAILGRTDLPMLQFKREGSGTWMYGQKRTIPEPGSRWAINPMTFMWGYVCFGGDKKVLDKRIVSVSQPKPLVTELPDLSFPWQYE